MVLHLLKSALKSINTSCYSLAPAKLRFMDSIVQVVLRVLQKPNVLNGHDATDYDQHASLDQNVHVTNEVDHLQEEAVMFQEHQVNE
jgi:hypothetical protein